MIAPQVLGLLVDTRGKSSKQELLCFDAERGWHGWWPCRVSPSSPLIAIAVPMRTYRFVGAVILVFAVASVAVFFALPMGRDGVRDAEADQAAASVTERLYGVSMQLERAQKESTAQFEHLSEKLQRLLDTQSHDVPNPGAAELAAPAHDAPDKQPGSVCANETARVTADRIDGLTPEAIRRSVGNRGNAQRVLRLMDKLRRGERVTVVAAGGSITLGHGLWSEGHSKFNPNFQAWPGQLLAWMQACQRAHMHARKDAHAHGRTPACTHKHTYTHTHTHTHTQGALGIRRER